MILAKLLRTVNHWLLPFKHGPLWGYRVNPTEPNTSRSDQHETPHHRHNRVEFMVEWPSLLLLRERVHTMHIEVEIRWPKISLKPPQQFGFDFFSELPLIARFLESAPGHPFIALIRIPDGYTIGGDEDTGVWTNDYILEKLKKNPLCADMQIYLAGLEEADLEDPMPCICFLDRPVEEELAKMHPILEDLPAGSEVWLGTLPDRYNLCEIMYAYHDSYFTLKRNIDKKDEEPPDVEDWLWENRLKLGCFFSLEIGADTAKAYFTAGSKSERIFIKHLDDLRQTKLRSLGLPDDY